MSDRPRMPPIYPGAGITPWPGRSTDDAIAPPRARPTVGGSISIPSVPGGDGGYFAEDGSFVPGDVGSPPGGPFVPGEEIPGDVVLTSEPLRYGSANGTKVFSVGTTSTPIISEPPGVRTFLYLRNSSASANVYVEFGADASTSSAVRLAANEQLILDAFVLQDDITAIADAASAFLSVMFCVAVRPS